jgi:hypothetical protein
LKTFLLESALEFGWIISVPFYYWFGTYKWFIEIINILSDLVDIVGIFYLSLIFIISLTLIRNYKFLILNKAVFKNFFKNFNILPLTHYLSFFYKNLTVTVTFLSNKFKSFFKKNK